MLENVKDSKLAAKEIDTIVSHFYWQKPIEEWALFFPSKENELALGSVLNSATKTLDICIFAFTNNVLAEAVKNWHRAGVKVRIICDDECAKFPGADVWELALEGVECTMDDN